MYMDSTLKMRQKDMIVFLVCDGFEKIPESFKKYAVKNQFFDIEVLKQKGFMQENRDGNW